MLSDEELTKLTKQTLCEKDHLYYSRYFFKQRQNKKFKVNWHHHIISDALQAVIDGSIKNLVICVSPGSSKTELVVNNFMSRALAVNPWARFLYLSYSDELALLNSQISRDIVTSEAFQDMWKLQISSDTKSKGRWNVLVDGKIAGGVYATSLSGQVTGFRAGHMDEGFQGAIVIDDPLKPDDAFSAVKLNMANRKLLTTVKSRKANPDTPIILIMQRLSERDPVAFIEGGNMPGDWNIINIPALIDDEYVKKNIPEKYHKLVDSSVRDEKGRFSYWPYKEPLKELLTMERGDGADQTGARISRHVFSSQYQQNPIALGGNIIRGSWFRYYKILPKIKYRKIYADTAQKTKEANDFSVFECWGHGEDGNIYLLDLIRGKWEAPELRRIAVAFWHKHAANIDIGMIGRLREMVVEDKSSGTGLVQEIKKLNSIPIKGIERVKDKLTRVMDVLSYIEGGMVYLPEEAPFTSDFILENESFTSDDSHAHDDMVDPMIDAIVDMLSGGNKLRIWELNATQR